jgi:hypothetical protein
MDTTSIDPTRLQVKDNGVPLVQQNGSGGFLSPTAKPSGKTGLITSVIQEGNHNWGGFYTALEWGHLLTIEPNAGAQLGGSEKFHGDVFMLSSWYSF